MPAKERRRYPRTPFYVEINVVGRPEIYYHPANNLSLGGVFLKTEFPLKVGTKVEVEFEDPIHSKPLRLPGAVAWKQNSASDGSPEALAQPPIEAGMGVAFHNVRGEAQKRLKAIIVSLANQGA